MRALVYLGPGSAELQDRPAARLVNGDDVVVEVTGTGVCGTDRKILLGRFPARPGVVLGHESVGVVRETGPQVRSVGVGDRVVVNPTLYCGWCVPCRRGATNFCRHKAGTEVGVDRDGTYAEAVTLPERFVERIPAGLPFRSAVLIEPLACVLNNVESASVTFDDTVVVLGAGPIGMLTALVAARRARRVTVAEPDGYRLEQAREQFTHVVDVAGTDPAEAVVKASGGERPSVVFDTTGTGLDAALRLVDDGGRVVVMGFDDTYTVPLHPLRLTNRGIRLIGAGDYRADIFPVAVDLAAELGGPRRPGAGAGTVPVLERLVTHEFPLGRHAEAFAALGGLTQDDGYDGTGRPPGYAALKVVIRSHPGPVGADGWPVDA
ncbi:zinc-binding dehydrogenase [Streptomyces lavendulae]|uniref:2-deoxy-scyllo-inosamine dehydrogenase n=1 Tax=Streptomyces lavendulae subsp. lavendulae TaxID=58340 RepID=A0A2K8PS14_STRLA|nr:alcohol dehydrogenase catalytic domain-containing protein [Streptomyces lavendulae]ATZ28613.1 D-arabitol-phosphate dehydrogenase [Streptomyces lavendulae subsp. lavendulae]QUQ58438.1 D-arabitol-phosphate dehydrogenase [Streptomyces lavendulae subsp. lavendulae]